MAGSIAQYGEALLAGRSGWKPIPAGLLHFTLKFFGATAPERVNDIVAALRRAASTAGPAELIIEGLGGFPSPTHALNLWLGLTQGGEAMAHLATEIDAACAEAGFAREQRPFTPHLTIGRLRRGKRPGPIPTGKPRRWQTPMTEVVLFRSELSDRGPTHFPLARIPLGETS